MPIVMRQPGSSAEIKPFNIAVKVVEFKGNRLFGEIVAPGSNMNGKFVDMGLADIGKTGKNRPELSDYIKGKGKITPVKPGECIVFEGANFSGKGKGGKEDPYVMDARWPKPARTGIYVGPAVVLGRVDKENGTHNLVVGFVEKSEVFDIKKANQEISEKVLARVENAGKASAVIMPIKDGVPNDMAAIYFPSFAKKGPNGEYLQPKTLKEVQEKIKEALEKAGDEVRAAYSGADSISFTPIANHSFSSQADPRGAETLANAAMKQGTLRVVTVNAILSEDKNYVNGVYQGVGGKGYQEITAHIAREIAPEAISEQIAASAEQGAGVALGDAANVQPHAKMEPVTDEEIDNAFEASSASHDDDQVPF